MSKRLEREEAKQADPASEGREQLTGRAAIMYELRVEDAVEAADNADALEDEEETAAEDAETAGL